MKLEITILSNAYSTSQTAYGGPANVAHAIKKGKPTKINGMSRLQWLNEDGKPPLMLKLNPVQEPAKGIVQEFYQKKI